MRWCLNVGRARSRQVEMLLLFDSFFVGCANKESRYIFIMRFINWVVISWTITSITNSVRVRSVGDFMYLYWNGRKLKLKVKFSIKRNKSRITSSCQLKIWVIKHTRRRNLVIFRFHSEIIVKPISYSQRCSDLLSGRVREVTSNMRWYEIWKY